jgi:hypothetical protein
MMAKAKAEVKRPAGSTASLLATAQASAAPQATK